MPAHDRGEVVQLEQGGEAVGVLLAVLQALDDRQLAFDQAQGAQGQVDEGGADAGAQPLQLGGGLGELGAQFLAGVGHLLALAHQVLAVGLQGGDPLVQRHGVRVQGVDRADHLGELVVAAREGDRLLGRRVLGPGEAGRAAAQDRQRAGQGAGHGRGDADRDQHQRAEDGDADLQGGDVVVPELREVLGAAVVERRLRAAHQVDTGGQGRVQLLGAGRQLAVGEGGLVGERGEVRVGRVDLGAGDRGVVGVHGRLRRGLAEVREGRGAAQPGLLGGGGERVALFAVRFGAGGGRGGQTGDGVDHRLGAGRDVQRGQQQAAGGGGLLDGGVQFGEGVTAGAGPRGRLLGQLLGEPVQRGDRRRVRLVGLEGAGLAGEGAPAERVDAVEGGAQARRGAGVGAQLLDLPVHPGTAVLGGRLVLGAAGRDVGGDLVAFVGEGVGEGERVLGAGGQRHQVLGVADVLGGAEQCGCPGSRDGGGHHGDGDDQPGPHMGGATGAHGGLGDGPLGGRLPACAPRPLLLHRCSHS
ncbi:hypothetical protein SCANM63S_08344 [Streptomyces canarius]